MNAYRSILLAAGLTLTGCVGPSVDRSTADASLRADRLTVRVVVASGGA